jgi:hypothetical protein
LKRKTKILLSLGTIILGWFMNAVAWTTKMRHPLSTISLILGLILMFTGAIFLIANLK